MFTNYLTLVPGPADRPRAVVRWNGQPPNNRDVLWSGWILSRIRSAPRQQVAAADLAREWDAFLAEKPSAKKRAAEMFLDDGWSMVAYWVSHPQLGLSMSLFNDDVTACAACGVARP